MTGFDADRQQLLDLLVDGELSDAQRRELLAWCEREPDGWRRCALAFLEAQDWSQVLGGLTEKFSEPVVEQQSAARGDQTAQKSTAPSVTRPQAIWQLRRWGSMLAMAASVALAFTAGLWIHDAGKIGRIVPGDPGAIHIVEDGKAPVRVPSGQPERAQADSMRLVGGGRAGAADEIQLPVMAGNELDSDWLLSQPAAMPDDVRRALERMGHQVEQRRQLVPYRLGDGRRVLVPVDQVDVRPVENRTYQ
jgi:hypothetical protein